MMRTEKRRAALVETLRDKGITDGRVLEAIGAVPRHAFIPETALLHRAYDDVALPIGEEQTISQPFTVAYMTSLLDPQLGSKILEIGTGSGYQAAVLASLGARVFSIERHRSLYERTRALLEAQGYRVRTRLGDGTHGWSAVAPFDGILATAGSETVPPALVEQLRAPEGGKPGGRLVIPVGDRSGQRIVVIRRTGPGPADVTRETLAAVQFVPFVHD
ncbi:MAG: protein-L-isoaspartate(D-aspartate) O-methyltransferase [Bacteroidota bacterium]